MSTPAETDTVDMVAPAIARSDRSPPRTCVAAANLRGRSGHGGIFAVFKDGFSHSHSGSVCLAAIRCLQRTLETLLSITEADVKSAAWNLLN